MKPGRMALLAASAAAWGGSWFLGHADLPLTPTEREIRARAERDEPVLRARAAAKRARRAARRGGR